ncbi:hypothetical protein H4S08_001172, partial [Coemansia sp. RSA 1365]
MSTTATTTNITAPKKAKAASKPKAAVDESQLRRSGRPRTTPKEEYVPDMLPASSKKRKRTSKSEEEP